jgi:transposase-like protein
MYLWRAIDQNGEVLDILVQARRDKRAALKLMRKLLKKHGFAPRTLVTDKWRTYGVAFRAPSRVLPYHRNRRMRLSRYQRAVRRT